MSSTPREIGTLIVVILKANHLPNKRHIGKQDPYCVVSVNGEKRRTKAVKRGGQHPEWDEEIRFTLYEDNDDVLERTARRDGTPPPPPPKNDQGTPKRIKGGKIMKLACYADDAREPDLIGDTNVDLTEVLTKGETDEWFTLMSKDKFAGKVYLELTFWSNEPAPEKKTALKIVKGNRQYGGPGSFVPQGELSNSIPHGASQPSRIVSTGSIYDHPRHNSDSVPPSLRASSSLARLDLYVPPYEQRPRTSPIDRLATDFGEFGVSEPRRRESFPPPHAGYPPRPSSSIGFSTHNSHHSQGYDQSISGPLSAVYPYDRPLTPSDHGNHLPYTAHPSYQSQYEAGPPSAYQQPPARGPRHSVPTSSSGFMPLSNPSSFAHLPSHPSEPGGFRPPVSHTPGPIIYNTQSQYNSQSGYMPQTPAPTSVSYMHTSSSASFQPQQSFPPSQSFQYPQYDYVSTSPAPPQQYTVPQPQVPPQAQPQTYQGYASSASPSHESVSAPPSHNPLSSSSGPGSRPLPQQPQQPQLSYGQPPSQPTYALPPSSSSQQQQLGSYSPGHSASVMFPVSGAYQPVPPPPPPPPLQYNSGPQSYPLNDQQTQPSLPPPPPQLNPNSSSRRRSSLPRPPINYQQQQQSAYQPPLPLPPPPPPPDFSAQNPLPPPPPPPRLVSQDQSYPGPPPQPPALADGQAQWIPAHGAGVYVQQSYS